RGGVSVGVSHGADTGRLRRVAEDLSVSAVQLLQVEQSGTASMGVLMEAWAGPDRKVSLGTGSHRGLC
ncbi:hypothetical protein, partial [Janibacter anophelis]|uniref:hypothetical protein n=1 Tax=Janibacter anophelis TaxID=319054 RepID=UPI0039EEBD30